MADLDTRNKRASALGIDSPFLHVFPNPDGVLDQGDRQQIARAYSGVASTPGSTNLDTRNKRSSAIGFDLPFLRVFPNPDAAIDQPDRQQVAWKYPAISSAAPGGGNLDTAPKRASAIGIDLPFLHVYPAPDGTITQADRQQVAWKYRAISSGGGSSGFRAAWARGSNIIMNAGGLP